MPVTFNFKTGAYASLIFFMLAVVCVNFIDKPLALFIHAQGVDQWRMLSYITEDGIAPLMLFCFLIFGIFSSDKSFWRRIVFIAYAIALFYLATWIREELGMIFARSWPKVWSGSGIYGGLVSDGQFGFHFFQSAAWKGSFPSGHSVKTSYICCMMFLIYPQFKYRYLWWLPLIAMVIALVLQNFHYLGDCFAGIALGVLVAYAAFYSWLKCFSQ